MKRMYEGVKKYIRAADYLTAVQIYLKSNTLLTQPLSCEHIKERLLGHWGTCPGITFVYAHLNRAIVEHARQMIFLLGPGHGFPALQANLFLEGSLSKYDEAAPRNAKGIEYIARQFSWPYGYPSHSSPTAAGVILEGGELGYALSTAFGAVLDNPSMIAACLIGDGEAETGPTAAAWHASKLIDPSFNGVVLPILHINGYKISGPTVYGRMSDEELLALFTGYGYEPHIVDAYREDDVHVQMATTLDRCLDAIRGVQAGARRGGAPSRPRLPMILLRTPKGWGSIATLDGKRIEDNHFSHQVIAERARTDSTHRAALERWLRSYRFDELFDADTGTFDAHIEALVPPPSQRMGDNPHTRGGAPSFRPLLLRPPEGQAHPHTCRSPEGCEEHSSMVAIGAFLRDVIKDNEPERNFRLFSPDETYSNKLDAVFEATDRAFVWPHKAWDNDMARDGRVIELLSEHTLQGMMQGYVLTGRHAVFASYEAFIHIVASMADQYAKFLSVAREVPWRGDIPSFNYLLTSSGWRQEHNGFSHQNPGFIDGMLQRQGCFVNVYFPPDPNTALVALARSLASKNEINLIVAGKRPLPSWRTPEEAAADIEAGIAVWDFASDEEPHVVFAAAGDYLTREAMAALAFVRDKEPRIRMRFVSIGALSAGGIGHSACNLRADDLAAYLTPDKPVIINFHGYPQTIKQMLFDYGESATRFIVRGYIEEGSTTTPFDMQVRNKTDRYHLAIEAFRAAVQQQVITPVRCEALVGECEARLAEHTASILAHGTDPQDISQWTWPSSS